MISHGNLLEVHFQYPELFCISKTKLTTQGQESLIISLKICSNILYQKFLQLVWVLKWTLHGMINQKKKFMFSVVGLGYYRIWIRSSPAVILNLSLTSTLIKSYQYYLSNSSYISPLIFISTINIMAPLSFVWRDHSLTQLTHLPCKFIFIRKHAPLPIHPISVNSISYIQSAK